jgi:hypothetical protein
MFILPKKDFTDMLCNEYEDREYPQDMTDSERMLAILLMFLLKTI